MYCRFLRGSVLWIVAAACLTELRTDDVRGDEGSGIQAALDHRIDRAGERSQNDRSDEKQRRAMAGLMALCGILVGGLGFVALVMIWGARLRRMARRELPPQKTLQNDLWFLKPPKLPRE
jgi:hypothetical protein